MNEALMREAMDQHLLNIHAARVWLVKGFLPEAKIILDLGGANAPLHRMGYPHAFSSLTMVDLPLADRHEMYAQINVIEETANGGEVRVLLADMTDLPMIEDNSIDLVWSGQSIEHVPVAAAGALCREAHRMLKPGGSFCLDTPNGAISSIHAATGGLDYIHPEHCFEAGVREMTSMIRAAGFEIVRSLGIRHMPETSRTGEFHYTDFLFGAALSDDVESSYIQYHHAVKRS